MVNPLSYKTARTGRLWGVSAAFFVCALPIAALADETLVDGGADQPSPWYVVGQIDYHASRGIGVGARDDSLRTDDLMSRRLSIDFNYGGGGQANVLSITEGGRFGTSVPGRETGGYALMFSGSYDVRTGTAVTPRISAGVGMSSRTEGGGAGVPSADPGRAHDVAPALELGLGADYAVSDTWGFSAEYRAFYHGASNTETGPIDPQVSQQFTIGAKIRF